MCFTNNDQNGIYARIMLLQGFIDQMEAQLFIQNHGSRGFVLNLNQEKMLCTKQKNKGLKHEHSLLDCFRICSRHQSQGNEDL